MIKELRDEIQSKLDEFYSNGIAKIVVPLYPYVKIYILSKADQKKGMLYLPEKQNKPVYEGLVIDTYDVTRDNQKPRVHIGDHVLFQHYIGIPVPDDEFRGDFRLMKEEEVIAVLDYDSKSIIRDKIAEYINPDVLLEKFIILDKDRERRTISGV